MLEQAIGCFAGNPRDLIYMVDMCVQTDLFGQVATLVGKRDQGVSPRVGLISYATWSHRETFRRETNALNMGNAEQSADGQISPLQGIHANQPFADLLEILRL